MLAASPASATDALMWCGVLLGAVVTLGIVVWLVRRWARTAKPETTEDIWSLQQLRQMRTEGQITEHEFQSLKAQMVQAARRGLLANSPIEEEVAKRSKPTGDRVKRAADGSR